MKINLAAPLYCNRCCLSGKEKQYEETFWSNGNGRCIERSFGSSGTWKYVNDQWKYQRGANKFAYNEWIQDKGKYYYLDNDGYVTTGWQQIEGQWYHMDSTGAMETGWFKDSDSGK